MVKEFTLTVRSDGSIYFRKSNNNLLGIRPGCQVKIRLDSKDGTARIKPIGYTCAICEQIYKYPLDSAGICSKCNDDIIARIKSGKSIDVAEAIAAVKNKRSPKEDKHK